MLRVCFYQGGFQVLLLKVLMKTERRNQVLKQPALVKFWECLMFFDDLLVDLRASTKAMDLGRLFIHRFFLGDSKQVLLVNELIKYVLQNIPRTATCMKEMFW